MNRRGFIGKMVGGAVAAAGVAASTGFARVAKSRAAATGDMPTFTIRTVTLDSEAGCPKSFHEMSDFWTPNSSRTQTLNASWFMKEPKT